MALAPDPTPIPHCPEPINDLRARYPLAIATPLDMNARVPPGFDLSPHVFDFSDGVRLIINACPHPTFGSIIFASGGVSREWRQRGDWDTLGGVTPDDLISRFQHLTGIARSRIQEVGVTEDGMVACWVVAGTSVKGD